MTSIDGFIERLRSKGFELTKDSNFAEYLGIDFKHNTTTNTITMTQPGLIKKILSATSMEDCNPNWTPANNMALATDEDEEPMNEKWGYSSIVGMLLYLSTNTRPDIAYAVSQVARFSHSPKQSHAAAVKTIVRYLARTIKQGTIFKPNKDFKLDCYVDANFLGLHGREKQDNPISAKSRTGYIIFFDGCPLVWKSQLQTETALSTFHSEYVALSQAMRVVVHLQRVLSEVMQEIKVASSPAIIRAEVFEDNNSTYLLANNQQLSPRSRHLNVKWHWFWEHVKSESITVSKINTEDQRADYLTKGLTREVFERIRKLNQGW
jgi:hypothetical protein